jgi:hypothetical protein
MSGDTDKKTGDLVATVLQSKHPDGRTVDASLLPSFTKTTDFLDLDIMDDIVETFSQQLSGSAGVPTWTHMHSRTGCSNLGQPAASSDRH